MERVRRCKRCGRAMERIETDETSWYECDVCGVEE